MKIMLTGINFNYENGYNADYTTVNLTFNNSGGATFNISGYITITKEQYVTASGDINQLTSLIKQEILNKLQEPETV